MLLQKILFELQIEFLSFEESLLQTQDGSLNLKSGRIKHWSQRIVKAHSLFLFIPNKLRSSVYNNHSKLQILTHLLIKTSFLSNSITLIFIQNSNSSFIFIYFYTHIHKRFMPLKNNQELRYRPELKKHTHQQKHSNVFAAATHMTGWRKTMEDAHIF